MTPPPTPPFLPFLHPNTSEFCGSPGFMAPEMVIDRQYDGKKADFWSLGCILLELLLTAKEFSTMWMKNFQVREGGREEEGRREMEEEEEEEDNAWGTSST